MILTTALIVIGSGAYIYTLSKPQQLDAVKMMGHRNDTILVSSPSGIDSYKSSGANVAQCVQRGDAAHIVYAYSLTNASKLTRRSRSFRQSPVLHQESASYQTGIIDYLYLLPGSSFLYTICLASTTSESKNATYFLFNSVETYWNYITDHQSGVNNSIYHQHLVAGGNNQTSCTEIRYNTTEPGYYFMMLLAPANISYSFNFTLDKVAYNVSDLKPTCDISDSECDVTFAGEDFKHVNYDILAYIVPDEFENSITTHLCLTYASGSSTLQKIMYISLALLGTGGLLLASCCLILVCVGVLRVRKVYRKSEEQQKLLHKY